MLRLCMRNTLVISNPIASHILFISSMTYGLFMFSLCIVAAVVRSATLYALLAASVPFFVIINCLIYSFCFIVGTRLPLGRRVSLISSLLGSISVFFVFM